MSLWLFTMNTYHFNCNETSVFLGEKKCWHQGHIGWTEIYYFLYVKKKKENKKKKKQETQNNNPVVVFNL